MRCWLVCQQCGTKELLVDRTKFDDGCLHCGGGSRVAKGDDGNPMVVWSKPNNPTSWSDDDDHLADCVDLDEADEEEWDLMACSMGRDGQCGQAGSEWCDFECPVMRYVRAEARRKAK